MDYTNTNLFFKIKKAIRFTSIYGPSRTLVKIRSYYHMNKKYDTLPIIKQKTNKKTHVGIIGCGKYAFANVAFYLRNNHGNVIRGVMDTNLDRAASFYEKHKASYYTDDYKMLLQDPNIDLIYCTSNHATHAEYGIEAIKAGKAVHIEKPHVVNIDQLIRLCDTIEKYNGRVRLGYNRPNSKLGQLVSKLLSSQKGETMLNWFVVGHKIDSKDWYYNKGEGGRILGNLCHWTDFCLNMIPQNNRFPIKIIPARSKKSDCDISVNFVFGDGSISTITFSAKGHTFEGVRETLNAHKGDVLIELKDFKKVRIDNFDKIIKKKLMFRDHGHQRAILNSYKMLKEDSLKLTSEYIWNTGYLMLKTKEALEKFETIEISSYKDSFYMEKEREENTKTQASTK